LIQGALGNAKRLNLVN